MSAQKLYTPELLALAVDLARWPALTHAAARGDARSPTCGSTVAIDLELDAAGRVADFGLTVRACAVGQAAAAVFAKGVVGRDRADLARALQDIDAWLEHGGDLPDWPGFAPLAPARDFPARHGAIRLPWKAALAALSSAVPAS
jgi:NifU-like protein involved in Fe-S cluster formation